MSSSSLVDAVSLPDLVTTVGTNLSGADLSANSAERLFELMQRFASFAAQHSPTLTAGHVTQAMVERFVRARTRSGSMPAVATMHLRRAAVRLLFAEGRRVGLVAHDPTLDLCLPPRFRSRTRPLTDEEVLLCRAHATPTLKATRSPAAWALAEATARSAKIAMSDRPMSISIAGRVWIHGSPKTGPRLVTSHRGTSPRRTPGSCPWHHCRRRHSVDLSGGDESSERQDVRGAGDHRDAACDERPPRKGQTSAVFGCRLGRCGLPLRRAADP